MTAEAVDYPHGVELGAPWSSGRSPVPVHSKSTHMSRPANQDIRHQLLTAGLQLIRRHGVEATGVKDVAEYAGVPKGSFYSYFASKDEFVIDVFEYYWIELQRDVGSLLEEKRSPLERLRAYFRAIAETHHRDEFILSCLIGNLGLEVSGHNKRVTQRLRAILQLWESQLADALSRSHQTDRCEVPALIIEAWEGTILRSKIDGTGKPYARFEAVTLPLLTSLCEYRCNSSG